MRNYTPRELRSAVVLAMVVTATVVITLLDPSCQPTPSDHSAGPSRSITPPGKEP